MKSHVYKVADYLLDRLAQMGIKHLFGVPGDYNLQFLDHVIAHPQITWVGCANELNAAYAADGYARTQPAAALLTTMGVGELSAINGVAGSFAEYLPVIHIVGAMTLHSQRKKDLMHHSLGDGDFNHFSRMAAEISCAQAFITQENAATEIDRVLVAALFHRKPVYLLMPADVVEAPLHAYPNDLELQSPLLSPASLHAFTLAARELLTSAHQVSVLADFLVDRFGATEVLRGWLSQTHLTCSTLLMGKGVIDESRAEFMGTYSGASSEIVVRQAIENADVLIMLGVWFVDTITCGFSQQIPMEKRIDIQPFEARVGSQIFSQIPMVVAIAALEEITLDLQRNWSQPDFVPLPLQPSSSGLLDQQSFWHQIQGFLRSEDVVICDVGSSSFGAASLRLPKNVTFIVQPMWSSIGYSLPAAYGVQTGSPQRRVILIIGDGAAQLSIQELGSMLRDGLKPIILLLNNNGYTVERAIHGENQPYNDISAWNWTQLPQAFGAGNEVISLKVSKPEQLQKALQLADQNSQLVFIEVILPQMDIPPLLRKVTEALRNRNAST
ncbi:thiamine pyrophosphate-binding protein [Yersinia nurmii]|uniref:Indole-3-pyruvate decarboxylase n=2 Tax=Yersinia nurmii TaxID=685706 RepID=A0AAW7K185_9GAMM|nr:thiamine pyrophosphate-binding protein [Yersinia nurmii]MDN0087197.1 thiamine pyrophosphate-binding protein [Yersinia nurmii]CNE09260.1 indole-3-pyruvate decarboxylase [Yersinia nurmii]